VPYDLHMNIELEDWLRELVERGGSILHLQAGQPPLGRVDGALQPLTAYPRNESPSNDASRNDAPSGRAPLDAGGLDADALTEALDSLFGGATAAVLADLGTVGTAYAYRVNVSGEDGAVIRLLQRGPVDLDSLGVPAAAQSVFGDTGDGLVLLAGRTGTGRSSTLAALLADRIASAPIHVAWIGDPPVFYPPTGRGRVTTLAVDVDTPSVADAIREAHRLDVDAIFIDPLHDAEAADLALRFAETGGLVVATVTAHGIPEALWRLIDPLEGESRSHANVRLSRAFRLALDHCLVPRADGTGRLAAFGVLHSGAPAPVAMIRDDKCHQLNSAAMVGRQFGMQSVSQALLPRVLAGDCTAADAIACIAEPQHLLAELQRARQDDP